MSESLVRDKSDQYNWPTFHATPHGKTWHVERDGQIIKTGTGLRKCGDWSEEHAQPAVERLVDKIKAILTGNTSNTAHSPSTNKPSTACATPGQPPSPPANSSPFYSARSIN